MRNIALIAAVAAVTLSLTGAAHAQAPKQGAGKPGGKPDQRMQRMVEKLGLTQAQQDKIKGISEKYVAKLKPIRDDKSLTKEQQREKVRPIIKSMNDEIEAVLTPEQRKKVKEMREANKKANPGQPGAKPGATKPGAKKP